MTSHTQRKWADLLKEIREEVLSLLAVQYIFRTVQEIFRSNDRFQDYPWTFNHWVKLVYVGANSAGIRRLAGTSPEAFDVNLVRLLDEMIRDADELWNPFHSYFQADLDQAYAAEKRASNEAQRKQNACRRLIAADRKQLINETSKTVQFVNKRVAHANLAFKERTTFNDLHRAIDSIKQLTEKYLLLVYARTFDLHKEMKDRKLQKGWEDIFLIPWATRDILALPLGEMLPPQAPERSRNT